MPDGSTLKIVIMLILVAFSAFFSASETAYTSFNRTKMKNLASEGNKRAARTLKLADNYDKLPRALHLLQTVPEELSSQFPLLY